MVMNFERHPFFAGVEYVDPLYPQVAVVGWYDPKRFEHECTDWELKTPDRPIEPFSTCDAAMQAAEDYLLGA